MIVFPGPEVLPDRGGRTFFAPTQNHPRHDRIRAGYSVKTNCPRCEGSGQCIECKGSGKVACPTCQGSGECTTPRGTTFKCKSCQGSGSIACPVTCDSCQGSGVITDKLQKQVREKYTARFANYSPLSRMTTYLVVLDVVFYFLTYWGPPDLRGPIFNALANTPALFADHEYWRLVTPVLLHGGLLHLAMNCYYLAQYCPPIEGAYGSHRFLWLYVFCAATGNFFSWLGHWVIQGQPYASVGASTALFGVGSAYLALYWRWRLFDQSVVRWWLGYMGILLAAGFAMDFGGYNVLNIDNWGHLGGALGGLAFVYLLPRPTGH